MHNTDTSPRDKQQWVITDEHVDERLDRFLVTVMPGTSRTTVQQIITHGSVLINNQTSKSGYMLRLHDKVEIPQGALPVAEKAHELKPLAVDVDVVYEDGDLLVINKAAGMVVHPAPGHFEDTLVNALLTRYPELQDIEDDSRPGIVHRLDRDTSGLLLVARNARSQTVLAEQMKEHKITKRYLALVEGLVELDKGSIDAPIGRNPRRRQQMTITTVDGREARTHFRVLQRYTRHTLLLLELETGRTHQIRVHLQAIGHPVVGDAVYGPGNLRRGIKLKRQFLHAYQLELMHPITGVPLKFEVALPEDLQGSIVGIACMGRASPTHSY
jgi:23S rRNA pseudouridine1911/1915/1917 synthase